MSDVKTKIILKKRETALESWKIDASTLVLGLAFVGIGWVIGSSALQWMGALVWIVFVFSQAVSKSQIMTISEARKWLDDMEAGDDQ